MPGVSPGHCIPTSRGSCGRGNAASSNPCGGGQPAPPPQPLPDSLGGFSGCGSEMGSTNPRFRCYLDLNSCEGKK